MVYLLVSLGSEKNDPSARSPAPPAGLYPVSSSSSRRAARSGSSPSLTVPAGNSRL